MTPSYKKPPRVHRYRPQLAASMAALGIALLAALVVRRAPEPLPPPIVTHEDYTLLPTPTREVIRGELIRDVPHTMMKWPRSRLTDHYLPSFSGLNAERATTALPRYLPIPTSAVAETLDDSNAVVGSIPHGMRAITVKVDIESAVEGWAQSGNSVDVLLISPHARASGSQEARVIADNIRILSAGRSAAPTEGVSLSTAPSTVTLLTTQEQALAIKAASTLGKITFALRGARDAAPSQTTTVIARSFTTAVAPTHRYRATAKGPDGRRYVLIDNARWMERGNESGGT